jgi:hypothetical protein
MQEADRQYNRIRNFTQPSIPITSQRPKGSERYRRIRRERQIETWKSVSIFLVLVILLAPSIVKAARGTFTKPDVMTVQEPVAVTVSTQEPTATSNYSLDTEVENFIRRVHIKESSKGTNANPNALHNICKAKGESNEYGYGGMESMMCFPSHADATESVAGWYREHRPLMKSEAMTYCYYALGHRYDTCAYWEEVKGW